MRIHRGTWVPLLPRSARMAVVTIVPLEPIVRGLDYVLPPQVVANQLSIVEQAMPLTLWGILCLTGGLLASTGFIGRWRRITITGLWIGGSTYAALAAGQWAVVSGEPWLDGVRGPAIVTLMAVAQLGMAVGYAQQQPADVEAS